MQPICFCSFNKAKSHKIKIYDYLMYGLEYYSDACMTDEELEKLAPWNLDAIEKCKFL